MKEEQKNKSPKKLWITLVGIVAAVILAVVLILINRGERGNEDWATVIPGESRTEQNGEVVDPTGEVAGQENVASEGQEENTSATRETASVENVQQNDDPIPTLGDEDPYEDWLASAMIIGISMQYSDYEFLGIYTASETPVAAHDSSAGAYVIFMGDGEKRALKAVPLDGERPDRGTADLYVPAIGYATYELIDPNSVPVNSLKERKIEDLATLISASTQVSIIER